MDIQEKIERFNNLKKTSNLNKEEQQELNYLAKEFLELTKQTYDKTAITYLQANETMRDNDIDMFNLLIETVQKFLHKSINEIEMLDVGTGSGRDIKYIHNQGVKKIVGLDNSEGFIKILEERAKEKEIPEGSFVKGDMLDLPFANETFDVVRQNASLVHIPITTRGEMLDKAIQECNRVLKKDGILYIKVKKGDGIQFIDTKDGLGGRVFQMHTIESITEVLEINKFKVLKIMEEEEIRHEDKIQWIRIIAKK